MINYVKLVKVSTSPLVRTSTGTIELRGKSL